jgi:hypothetical protein
VSISIDSGTGWVAQSLDSTEEVLHILCEGGVPSQLLHAFLVDIPDEGADAVRDSGHVSINAFNSNRLGLFWRSRGSGDRRYGMDGRGEGVVELRLAFLGRCDGRDEAVCRRGGTLEGTAGLTVERSS